jgi:butyrate kinase
MKMFMKHALGTMAAVLNGKAEAIILTGGISHDKYLEAEIKTMHPPLRPSS